MPHQSHRRGAFVASLDADLVQRELAVLVEFLLRRHPAAGLVVVDLDGAVGRAHDAVDDAPHAVATVAVEREADVLLDAEALVAVEGIVAAIVVAEAALAVLAVDLGRVLGAHDAHALGLELLLPVGAEALEHLRQRRHDATLDETVQLLDHFVDALADEGLDRLGVDRSLLDVAVVELLLALLEAGQPRVAVDGRQWASFSKICQRRAL